jgi:hypothetical protein
MPHLCLECIIKILLLILNILTLIIKIIDQKYLYLYQLKGFKYV